MRIAQKYSKFFNAVDSLAFPSGHCWKEGREKFLLFWESLPPQYSGIKTFLNPFLKGDVAKTLLECSSLGVNKALPH